MFNVSNKTIIAVGGGTGGHLFPAIEILKYVSVHSDYKCHLITDRRCKNYINENYKFGASILDIPRPKKTFFGAMNFVFQGIIIATKILLIYLRVKPTIVIGFGGYVTFIPILIAKLFGCKIILHEQNAYPGLVNRILAPYADIFTTAFPGFLDAIKIQKDKIKNIGHLVRSEFFLVKKSTHSNMITILIYGGSQGSKFFTDIIPNAICHITNTKDIQIQVIHQVHETEIDKISRMYYNYNINARVASFFHDMPSQYSVASFAITRAGASTIGELIATETPAILIPLPNAADDHQRLNATLLASHYHYTVINQSDINHDVLTNKILDMIDALRTNKLPTHPMCVKTNATISLFDLIVSIS